ncbi:MAG: transposase [Anaerolineae bacterium]|nr:transposase [Anaerolineae bacterium]
MEKKAVIRYSEAFKRQVVREYEAGASAIQLGRKYGIKGGNTVSSWVKKYGREGSRYELMVIQKPEEQAEVKRLQERVKQLERALAQTMLDKLMLESLVETLEAETGVDLKKNIGRPRLNEPGPKAKNKGQGRR